MRTWYVRIASAVDNFTATPVATALAFALVIVWAVLGPRFHFSDTWQLVMNSTSSVVTFIMVFIIASAQNRNTTALHLKLDMLIAASETASNKAIAAESASTEVIAEARDEVARLADGTANG
jgi:low affinity Fe/Cu permease